MLVFNSRINIGDYQLEGANEIQISSSHNTLSDTAVLKLPGLDKQLEKQFQIGDAVEVYLGYDGDYQLEFTG